MKRAFKARILGKVQGVWFRKYTRDKARELGITGIVKNEPDGSVYVEAEGDEDALNRFKRWLYEGSPMSIVEEVITEEMPVKNYSNFEIIY